MKSSIFLLDKNEELSELPEKVYDSELILQELLSKYPGLLAGGQINEASPRKWLLIANEINVGNQEDNTNWSVDNLFIDQDAVPTIIEVKRSSDTRIRREVVGQMLDYAANAVTYWPIEHLRETFETRCNVAGLDPANELLLAFGAESDYENFWMQVKTNLQAGKIRMVFVADVIPNTLKRIVEFLNTQMDPAEVLALEVKKFSNDSFTTLVPRLLGQTAEAQQRKTQTPGEPWNEERFLSVMKEVSGQQVYDSFKQLLDWTVQKGLSIWWGRGKKYGSWIPSFDAEGEIFPFLFWTGGEINVQFDVVGRRPLFATEESRLLLLEKLNKLSGVNIPRSSAGKFYSLKSEVLKKPENAKIFLEIFQWLYDFCRK